MWQQDHSSFHERPAVLRVPTHEKQQRKCIWRKGQVAFQSMLCVHSNAENLQTLIGWDLKKSITCRGENLLTFSECWFTDMHFGIALNFAKPYQNKLYASVSNVSKILCIWETCITSITDVTEQPCKCEIWTSKRKNSHIFTAWAVKGTSFQGFTPELAAI
jgi:hypothetical protein